MSEAGPPATAGPGGGIGERFEATGPRDRDLTVFHGQLRAVTGLNLSVESGEVYAIIGANGAGKSTLLRTIAGVHAPAEGSILLEGAGRLRPAARSSAWPRGSRWFPKDAGSFHR